MEENKQAPEEEPKPLDTVEQEADDPMSKFLSLETVGGVPLNSRCKLCQSPERKIVEEMWDKGTGPAEIKKYLDAHGLPIALSNICNHLKRHYKNQEAIAYLIEFAENAKAMMMKRRSIAKDVEFTVIVGYLELARVLALSTNGDLAREKDRNEMWIKTIKSIREGEEFLKNMHDENMRVRAVKEKVLSVFRAQIENAKAEEEKERIIELLKSFKASYEAL